jgi:hypothetical protein
MIAVVVMVSRFVGKPYVIHDYETWQVGFQQRLPSTLAEHEHLKIVDHPYYFQLEKSMES